MFFFLLGQSLLILQLQILGLLTSLLVNPKSVFIAGIELTSKPINRLLVVDLHLPKLIFVGGSLLVQLSLQFLVLVVLVGKLFLVKCFQILDSLYVIFVVGLEHVMLITVGLQFGLFEFLAAVSPFRQLLGELLLVV